MQILVSVFSNIFLLNLQLKHVYVNFSYKISMLYSRRFHKKNYNEKTTDRALKKQIHTFFIFGLFFPFTISSILSGKLEDKTGICWNKTGITKSLCQVQLTLLSLTIYIEKIDKQPTLKTELINKSTNMLY